MSILSRLLQLVPTRWIKAASRLQWRHPLLRRGFELVADRLRHQDSQIGQGIGRGLSFNCGNSNAGAALGTLEPELQHAFSLFLAPGMIVFDIGANVGFFSVIAARLVGDSGRVISFDPLASNIKWISHNAGLNHFGHIMPLAMALGNVDGEATFVISSNPNWGMLKSVGKQPANMVGEERVPIRRIDSLIVSELPAPQLMKIDVEGAESEVLSGARQTLLTNRPVLFVDLHGTNALVADLFSRADYQLRGIGKGDARIVDTRWDTQVIAVPAERKDLLPKMLEMSRLGLT